MSIKDYKRKSAYTTLGLKRGRAAIKRETSPVTYRKIFIWLGLFALIVFVNYMVFVNMRSISREKVNMSTTPKNHKESGNFTEQFHQAYQSYQDGDLEKAAEVYTKAITLKPDDIIAYFNRGVVYSEIGMYDKAIDDYNKVIELNPDYAEAYNNRGWAYIQKGLFDLAIQDCDKAVGLDPDMAAAYHTRGVSYRHIGSLDKAKNDFKKSCELGDNNGCIELKELSKVKKDIE